MKNFHAMRQRLADRGLIDGDFRLTKAGHREAEAMMAQLRDRTETNNHYGRRVRWRRTPERDRNG